MTAIIAAWYIDTTLLLSAIIGGILWLVALFLFNDYTVKVFLLQRCRGFRAAEQILRRDYHSFALILVSVVVLAEEDTAE